MVNINVCCATAKNPRQGLTLAFPSATTRQPPVSTSKSHPSIAASHSVSGFLEEMEFPTQMYAIQLILLSYTRAEI